jgi:hypothetical protein
MKKSLFFIILVVLTATSSIALATSTAIPCGSTKMVKISASVDDPISAMEGGTTIDSAKIQCTATLRKIIKEKKENHVTICESCDIEGACQASTIDEFKDIKADTMDCKESTDDPNYWICICSFTHSITFDEICTECVGELCSKKNNNPK